MRLRLPLVLTSVIVGTVAVVACSGDDEPPRQLFCVERGDLADAGAGAPDAQMCGQLVARPQDCPEGCEAVSLA